MNKLILPDRFKNIEKINNFITGQDNIKLAVKPEYQASVSLEKAKIAIEPGLNDVAIN